MGDSPRPPICIVVPFDTLTDLAVTLLRSLEARKEELKDLRCTLILINGASETDSLSKAKEFLADVPVVFLQNEENFGFVRAVNLGLKHAVERSSDVVILGPDRLVYPGALLEMQRIAYLDSMIGFVSPRSNDGAMGSLPPQREFHQASPARALANFSELSRHLPAFQYVPLASESCMFIKLEILKEFGFFDQTCLNSHDAGVDLVMRANRCGYRAALANHAFIYHAGPTLQPATSSANTSRYPEYPQHLEAHFKSAQYQAEVLLTGLLKDDLGRHDIVFDFSSFGPYHNGTFEAAKQILIRAATSWKDTFSIHVLIDDKPARFHGLHQIQGITLAPSNTSRVFAIAFRFGQPFQYESVLRMSRLAVFNVYSMLDPIAWDCLYLHDDELDETWRAVFSYADAVTYLSDFVAEQFRLRFQRRAEMRELIAYPSLDTSDYLVRHDSLSRSDYLLVVGNAFAHKNVLATVEILSGEFRDEKIVALGLKETTLPNVVGYESGHLSDEQLHKLFLYARAVIFPSFYEGFGIPIVRGLAYQKPVLARSTQVNRDLSERLGRPADLILYDCTADLVSRLKQGWPTWKGLATSEPDRHDWATTANQIGDFLRGLVNEVSYSDVLIPRLEYTNLLRRTAKLETQVVSDSMTQELKKEISDLRIAVRDKDLQIQSLFSSLSWAVTSPMRSLGSLWIRFFGPKTD